MISYKRYKIYIVNTAGKWHISIQHPDALNTWYNSTVSLTVRDDAVRYAKKLVDLVLGG
jgi:hypothetical protein